MNLLFTVCGRGGSKGIKNKNSRNFLGKPLVYYTLSTIDLYVKRHPDLNYDVVLNTDSESLIALINEQTIISVDVIRRRAELALDNTPKVPVILNCLEEMENQKQKRYDMVVDLDITSPLRTVEDLNNLIQTKEKSTSEIVFSVTESRRNPYFNMVKKTDSGYERVIQSEFNARQEAPEIFDMNASLYAYEPGFLKSGKGIFDTQCDVIKMMDTGILDLDHVNDCELMEVIAQYLYDCKKEYGMVREHI
ncbi:MAG: acylneuraminate cytidylyltransferase family protein [Eubacterium sp.]